MITLSRSLEEKVGLEEWEEDERNRMGWEERRRWGAGEEVAGAEPLVAMVMGGVELSPSLPGCGKPAEKPRDPESCLSPLLFTFRRMQSFLWKIIEQYFAPKFPEKKGWSVHGAEEGATLLLGQGAWEGAELPAPRQLLLAVNTTGLPPPPGGPTATVLSVPSSHSST